MDYADFEKILVSIDNENHNPEESYRNKDKQHLPFSYGFELVCVDDKFSKSFNHTKEKIQFTILLIEQSKKGSTIVK